MINRIKKKKSLGIILALVFATILLFQISNYATTIIAAENESNSNAKLNYWTDGVEVSDANISALSTSGTGAQNDPYIIENLNVNTTDSTAVRFDGVSLTTHWVLRDSHIIGNTYGVYIADNTDGKATLKNCTIDGALTVGTPNAKYVTIDNCTLLMSNQGSIWNAGMTFTNNIVRTTSPYSNHMGRFQDEDNLITDNVFYGNNSHIYLQDMSDSTVENNELIGAGFHIYNNDVTITTSNTIEGNTVDGKPYGFFYNKTGEIIDGNIYGQIYLFNSVSTRIEDQTLSASQWGLQIHKCTDVVVDNVEVYGKGGIEVKDTDGITIQNCYLEGFWDGLDFGIVTDVTIFNNILVGYNYAIDAFNVEGFQITNNTFLEVTENGMYIDDCQNVEIKFNIVTLDLEDIGFDLALVLWLCENVTIYYNVFIDTNNNSVPIVEGNGSTDIVWYDATLEVGNHYSDWNGTGSYQISGGDASIDLYPFIDIDGDNLTEWQEVMIYLTNPFEADSDFDGFNDDVEIEAGTDPLDPKDYPGRGRTLGIVLGLIFGLGIIAAALYILNRKEIINLPFLKKK